MTSGPAGPALRPLGVQDLETVLRLRLVSFGGAVDEDARQRIREAMGRGEVLGWVEGDVVLATVRLSLVDHWFAERRVPCQHVASVAVPPEHRGRGVASACMRAVLAHGVDAGAALSLLYPATTALYRGLGWEHAGTLVEYRLDARQASVRGQPLRRLEGDADWAALRDCAEAAGRAAQAVPVRPDHEWARLRAKAQAYGLDGEDGGLDAYLVYEPTAIPDDWQYRLQVADLGATTPRGLAALLSFVGRHGTVGKDAAFSGPVPHPFALLVPEQDVRRRWSMAWMARALDLPAAVAARGFPPGLSLRVTLAVDDPLLPTNAGPWALEVADGRGQLSPTSQPPAVHLDVRAVGPLYTGYASPQRLVLTGLASGPADDVALLGAAFAAEHPVLIDFF